MSCAREVSKLRVFSGDSTLDGEAGAGELLWVLLWVLLLLLLTLSFSLDDSMRVLFDHLCDSCDRTAASACASCISILRFTASTCAACATSSPDRSPGPLPPPYGEPRP